MGRKTQGPHKARRRGVARGLKVGGLVAVLALLAAVPVALAATSSIEATTSRPRRAGRGWGVEEHEPDGVDHGDPGADATVTAHFSSDNGATWMTQSADDTDTATFGFVVSAEGSHAIQFYASDTSPADADRTDAGLRQHRQDRSGVHDDDRARGDLHAERSGALVEGDHQDDHAGRDRHAAGPGRRHIGREGDLAACQW